MYYLAVDIGASSGRHIISSVENGTISIQEIYRFTNGATKKNGHLCWDVKRLFAEIVNGMKVAKEKGMIPVSMGIDCFGVDFVLLDEAGEIVGDSVSYRDSRTTGVNERVFKTTLPRETMYERTGICPGVIDSVFQLVAVKEAGDDLARAKRFLQLPDYFGYLLTGKAVNEMTNAETTALLNAKTLNFDTEMLTKLGIPTDIFQKPVPPKTIVGDLRPEIAAEVGYNCKLVLPPTHDTMSAMTAAPASDDSIIISSGTWSMMAVCLSEPILTKESLEAGFSNMYIDENSLLYIKGITGLWMLQSIKKELDGKYSYDEMCDMAMASEYSGTFDVNDPAFSAPESMIETIKSYLASHGKGEPATIGDVIRSVYFSLASKYAETVRLIETVTGRSYEQINVVGGGSKDPFLTKLTEEYTGKKVLAGPSEATAIGNLMAQFVAMGDFASSKEAKEAVKASLQNLKL